MSFDDIYDSRLRTRLFSQAKGDRKKTVVADIGGKVMVAFDDNTDTSRQVVYTRHHTINTALASDKILHIKARLGGWGAGARRRR